MKKIDNHILIYYSWDSSPKGAKGYDRIILCAKDYARRTGLECDDTDYVIDREKKGKPYFVKSPIKFSLSHSSELWICAFSLFNIGIDVEKIAQRDTKKIAERYFSRYEQAYVADMGMEAFYKVWTFKEAVGKFTGNGIFADKRSIENVHTEDLFHVEHFDLRDKIGVEEYVATGVWESKYGFEYDFVKVPY